MLHCDVDGSTRAGKIALLDPAGIERPESLDWHVFISNAETAADSREAG